MNMIKSLRCHNLIATFSLGKILRFFENKLFLSLFKQKTPFQKYKKSLRAYFWSGILETFHTL